MTEPLLNTTDFAKFKAKDEEWFLGAVGETIRDYCGWHIWPVVSVVNVETKIGNKGIIMLPTLKLVSVEQIAYDGPNVLEGSMFQPHEAGYIEFLGYMGRRGRNLSLTVDFTHGYEDMPQAVAEVGYELTARTMEQPAGAAVDITRGPTRIKFGELGSVLSDDQKARLGPYTIVRV